eukprot:GILJ01006751.1.p1 GENE.GILJ01006751.1~~GILJ01006751.1.p1  ORF type:complete len:598 (-),score=65.09 GILJ01006751.1:440-2233(-)
MRLSSLVVGQGSNGHSEVSRLQKFSDYQQSLKLNMVEGTPDAGAGSLKGSLPILSQTRLGPLASGSSNVRASGLGAQTAKKPIPSGQKTSSLLPSSSGSSKNIPALPIGKLTSSVFTSGQIESSQTSRQSIRSSQSTQKPLSPRKEPQTSRPASNKQGEWGEKPDSSAHRPAENLGVPLPMTPATALKLFMNQLSDYEQGEILDYQQVYFLGTGANKIRGTASSQNNHGYDDERGDYQIVLHDHIAFRYEVISTLGKGSFGQVVKAFDYKNNEFVALKIIRNKRRFHHQALVEVKILEHLRDRDVEDSTNIVHIKDYFYFRSHLCITFELLSINLYEFIKNNNFQGVSLGLIRRFAVQLLTSLRFLRKQRVIHCDLKPENILLKQPNKSGIKVIDFGSSCFEDERVYTYIQSRFYRSPEVILGLPYDVAIDMWSFGCILAELYTGYPLFPGENEVEQLACIMEVMGLVPPHIIEASTRKKMFFDTNNAPRIVPNSRGKKRKPGTKDLVSALRINDSAFINFLECCLRWDPRERFTPEDALQHEWILEGNPPAPPPQETSSFREIQSRDHRKRHYKKPTAGDQDKSILFPPIDPSKGL